METAIIPGVVFNACFEIKHVDGELDSAYIQGKVVDWHFQIHDFSQSDDILEKTHLLYSVQILDSNNEDFYEIGESYIIRGRNLYPAITYVIESPKDIDDLIRLFKTELKRAFAFEVAAAQAMQYIRAGLDKQTAYSLVNHVCNYLR